jgi:tetratricopeptide (TPR) repeat protein
LLVLITTLIVARPFVLGEDPGMLDDLSDSSGLVLTLFWLVAAVAWAGWRLWSGQGAWYGGLVEAGLFVVVACMFVSATAAAGYKHAAWLAAWEWLGLFVAFCLVRQFAVSPEEQHGLFAAVLATAVPLSAYAVYQYTVELPEIRRQYGADPDKLHKAMAQQHVYLDTDDPLLELLRRRVNENNVYGTYAHPNSFAGYLALWLPCLAGAAVVSYRGRAPRWQTALAVAFALLGGVALWLTHSRGAILALAVVGLAAAILFNWRRVLLVDKRVWAVGVVCMAVAGFLTVRLGLFTSAFGKNTGTMAKRLDYWPATWKMIADHPWLGVGPANFGRAYPRWMSETASEKIKEPHNFALEVWSSAGLFALLGLLTALAAFFFSVVRWLGGWTGSGSDALVHDARPSNHLTTRPPDHPTVRWEFYLGGTCGLLLGFILYAGDLAKEEVLRAGIVSAGRSVLWFLAFAVFERIRWTARARVGVLTAGVAALLLNLCVSDGIGFPSVALMLWVAVALALSALPQQRVEWASNQAAARALPLPLLAATALFYFLGFFLPVTGSATSARRALLNGQKFIEEGPRKSNVAVSHDVIVPLKKAVDADPTNARLWVHLASWYGQLWELNPNDITVYRHARDCFINAKKLDPEGPDPLLAQYHFFRVVAQVHGAHAQKLKEDAKKYKDNESEQKRTLSRADGQAKSSKEQYNLAGQALQKLLTLDPTDARLHYRAAEAFRQAGASGEWPDLAREALRLDDRASPSRKLSDTQRGALWEWLQSAGPG